MNRGFTIIEVIITLAIISILLALSTFGMKTAITNAGDAKRDSDVAIFARGLEQRYNLGNPVITSTSDPTDAQRGSYPSVHEMDHIIGWDQTGIYTPGQVVGGYVSSALPGTSLSSMSNPSGNGAIYVICQSSCAPAEDSTQKAYPFTVSPYDWYVYEPIDGNGNICYTGVCRRFNLYYKRQIDGVIVKVSSRHQ